MSNQILVITDNVTDAYAIKRVLGKARDGPFKIEWVRKLVTALNRLRKGGIDIILVDLSLPYNKGISTFDQLFAVVPRIPIMVICTEEHIALAIEAVERGAQGYLLRGFFCNSLVPQALRNIIHRKAVEESLHLEKTRAEIAMNSISDAVICTDMSGKVNYLNIAAEKLTGWGREEAQGHAISEVLKTINGLTRKALRSTVEMVLERDKVVPLPADTIMVLRNGSEVPIEDSAAPIHDSEGNLTGAVIVFRDVSAAYAMSAKMSHLAQHDYLTNLPNRLLLNDRIEQSIALAKRDGSQLAVLFLDLDKFKHVNDSLGHSSGDKLLLSVTHRLNHCVRSSDTVSRQGGDEFVILLRDARNGEAAALIADKILSELALPHTIAKKKLHITTSIGVSIYPEDGHDADTLIKNADTAMYSAKEDGRNNYKFYSTDMNSRAIERQLVEANLRHALEKQEFVLHYQPKVNLETGNITGAEALLRWKHEVWGMVLPGTFVDIAEDCGLIVPIGRWVLREACTQAKKWVDAGLKPFYIAVNISAIEFRQKDFLENVQNILTDSGLDACCLQLEITESDVMKDAASSAVILHQLKAVGIQLAVDDFGTGYSSLSYLKQFPIDMLKIDQSFVDDIKLTTDEGVIVSAIIAMGNSLKLKVVAEGIESEAQLEFLKARNCREGQGYYFSRPVSPEAFAILYMNGISSNAGKGNGVFDTQQHANQKR
jgi:diguanylate cyclase (GGDEF)-like protein/PAS domain S-box-containing protein